MRNVLPLNDGVYKISIIKPTHSHHLCHTKVHSSHFPLFLKTTPFNKFIYSKTFEFAWVSIISLCLFQWLCFLLQHILRNFKLSMYDIMFGKNFVHALFVCHDYWANHPTPYAAHTYESLKYLWLFTEMLVHSSKNCNIAITIWPGTPPKLCVKSLFSLNMKYNLY